jgi:hypothetical protein
MRGAAGWLRLETLPTIPRVEPPDGATQVLRDAPVVLQLSTPVDLASLSSETLRVQDPEGPVPGRFKVSPDLQVVIWGAERPFRAGVVHFVVVRGLRDVLGRPVPPHCTRFVPCDLARDDLRF